MKIGIETKGFETWGGGIDFIRHLASAIEVADEKHQYEKHLLLIKNDWRYHITKLTHPYISILQAIRNGDRIKWQAFNKFDQNYLKKTFSNHKSIIFDFPGFTFNSHLKYAKKKKFDILLPCINPPSKKYDLPWVGYIYDFQHKYYPQFFSKKNLSDRDFAFTNMLKQSKHVIVNAKMVKSDIEKFMPDCKTKIHILPFSPSPMVEWLNDTRDLRKQYGIEKPYFIISNQFWIHKDHKTAFKGFSEFLDLVGKKYQLVCTGSTNDYRFPNYYIELLNLIKQLGIKEDVKILGHIPKLDQIVLLKKSIAVIQPTLFEGGPGGGASYDAISLGKPLIVSDIAVNREIEENERVFFFMAKNTNSLMKKMNEVSKINFNNIPNKLLYSLGMQRKKVCGKFLLKVIRYATG